MAHPNGGLKLPAILPLPRDANKKTPMNRPTLIALALTPLIVLGACTTSTSTAQHQNNKTPPQMFQLSEAQADRLLLQAMSEQFHGHPISKVELPNKGYQTMIRFGLDSDNVTAYMEPAKGRAPDGAVVSGYVFRVSRSGTMLFSGTVRASNLFRRIVRYASAESKPLPLAD